MAREAFRLRGRVLPEASRRAVLLGSGAAGLAAAWGLFAGRFDVFVVEVAVAVLIPGLYLANSARHGAALDREDAARSYRLVSVGFSLDGGAARHVALGAGAFIGILWLQILQSFLGLPQAASLNGFFTVVVLAPIQESVLFSGGLWSLVYSAAPGTNGQKWVAATVLSGLIFSLVWHDATYTGESSFAFADLFLMFVLFSLAAWGPTFAGARPSLLPAWLAHTFLNGAFYGLNCVANPAGVASLLASRLCR